MRAAIYARVSTSLKLGRQNPDTQLLPLRQFVEAHAWKLTREYVDDISAVKERPRYSAMLAAARRREFDVVVVVRLDRIFRSMKEFVNVIQSMSRYGVRFICTDQPIDTDRNDPAGALLMTIIAAVAEFERNLISERVKAGLARAKAQGKKLGGSKAKQIDMNEAIKLYNYGWTMKKIAGALEVNRNLLAKQLRSYLNGQ